ncbi:MAG: hypothetical protein AB7S26_06555 [Sandaracinaceae bacterium]
MTTLLVATLAGGVALGLAVGVPIGRFWERVRPKKKNAKGEDHGGEDDEFRFKKKTDKKR